MTFRRHQAIRLRTAKQQAEMRDRLISYQAAHMTRQIEQYLAKEAGR